MSAAKHTPGPWTAKWSKYTEGVFIVQAGPPSNRVLAQFDGDGDGPDAQSIADANLIAAAPELLEALQRLIPLIDVTISETCHAPGLKEAADTARAAIAKAAGSHA